MVSFHNEALGRETEGLRAAVADVEAEANQTLLSAARAIVHPHLATAVEDGPVVRGLLQAAQRVDADLLAVGSHGQERLFGVIVASVATEILHRAPRSVLFSRPAPQESSWPATIVCGFDGSAHATRALEIARGLAAQLAVELRVIVATGGKPIDLAGSERLTAEVTVDRRRPANALVDGASAGDLIVVGSRGLHGVRALGSVSERVAHSAPCSVLVVR